MGKTINVKNTFIFGVLIVFFFLLDICAFSFFERPIFYLVLSFYLLQLFMPSPVRLSAIGAFILLESFIYFGLPELPLLYLIPISLLGYKARKNLYMGSLAILTLGSLGILAQCLLIETFLLHNAPLNHYTLGKISGNIIMMTLLFLTCKPR
jgi:hypothetical protein